MQALPLWKRLNTYAMLKLSRTLALGLVGLLLLAIVIGAQVHRDAMQTVGKDAAPSIVAAQQIKAALADLDADEANELLSPPNTANAGTKGILKRRGEADAALLDAEKNVTYDGERAAIETMQVTGGLYNRLAQQAEDLHDAESADDLHPDRPSVRYYRADAIVMDGTLLPAADALDQVNDQHLQSTYHSQALESGLSTAFVVLAGLLLLCALVAVQVYLSTRTHRTLNPFLALGTFLALGLLAYSLIALATEQHQLKIAKEDAFESVHYLLRARAVAYQAHAEQSRSLLDVDHASEYRARFVSESNALIHLPAGMDFDQVYQQESAGEQVAGLTGSLADELHNITFPGEKAAALKTLATYTVYLGIDQDIQKLEKSGQHQQAIDLCIGSGYGQSNWAFGQFDSALGQTLAINQQVFESSVRAGLDAVGELGGKLSLGEVLGTLELKALLAAILIAVMIVLGYAPRIREYE